MADDLEPALRNALDAIHAGRKWALLGITTLFFAVAILLAFMFSGAARAAAPQAAFPLKAFWLSSAAIMLLVLVATIVLMMHVTRMTRVVLRAIEAAARK